MGGLKIWERFLKSVKTNLKNSQNVTAEMNNFAKEAKIKFRYLFLWDPSYLRIRE